MPSLLQNVVQLQDAVVSRGHSLFFQDHGSCPVNVRLCDSSEAGNYGQRQENSNKTSTDGRVLSVDITNGGIFQRSLFSHSYRVIKYVAVLRYRYQCGSAAVQVRVWLCCFSGASVAVLRFRCECGCSTF